MFTTTSFSPSNINPPQDLRQIYRSQVQLILRVCLVSVLGLSLALVAFDFPFADMDIQTERLVLGLLAIHLLSHLFSARVERRLRLAIVYLFAQILLLFYTQTLCHYPILLTFMVPLLSEIVIIFEALWLVPVTVILIYILQMVSQLMMFASPSFQGI